MRLLRKLSSMEIMLVQGKMSVFTYSNLTGLLYPDVLQQAIQLVMQRHPLLNGRIVKSDNDFYLQKKSRTKAVIKIFENVDKKQKHALFCQEFNKPLKENQSLCRIILMLDCGVKQISKKTKSTLIIIVHHAISDGVCGMELQHKVLETYADLMHNRTVKIVQLPFMPSVGELIKDSTSLGNLKIFIKQYHAQYANAANAKRLEPMLSNDSKVNPQINFLQKSLSQKQTQLLITQCKLNKTTVHGAICAASLMAIKERLDKEAKAIILCCHMPVDMRRRLEPPVAAEHMFCAAGGIIGCYKVSQNISIWDLGKKINGDIRKGISSKNIFREFLMFEETAAKIFPKITAGISTVGNINIANKYHRLKVQEISGMGVGIFPVITITSVIFNNKLIINYLYTNPWFAETIVRNIANNINRKLCV
jgi:NRPS condensation-like uncharacterized protein